MLVKDRKYLWNVEEAREPSVQWTRDGKMDNRGGWGTATGGRMPLKTGERRRHNPVGGGPKGAALIADGTHGVPALLGRVYDGTRNIRNVWSIASKADKAAHTAIFPQKLVERCLQCGSKEGDIVLDPFGGSGTTGIVAKRMGRIPILLDTSYEYCELMTERLK
jgi:hypothetical protein